MKVAVLFENLGPYHIARLNAMPVDLDVFAVERRGKSIEYQWSNDERPSCRTFQLFASGENDGNWRVLRKRLRLILEKEKPDVLLVNGWADPMTFAALSWSLLNNRATIVMTDSSVHDKPRSRLKETFKKFLLQLFDAYLAAGTTHVEYLKILGVTPANIRVGFDAVDNQYFANKSKLAKEELDDARVHLELPDRYFLASARFVEKKNLGRLIEAYSIYVHQSLEQQIQPRHLVILGDGPLKSDILKSIEVGHVSEWVHLPGFQQYDVLPSYYAHADGFVHASTEEQWGLVVNEAMACSLPVAVSNRCGCAVDLVHSGENGFVFDPYDVQSIAESIRALSNISDTDRQKLGAESYRIISDWGLNRFHDGVAQLLDCIKGAHRFKNSYLRRIASLVLNLP